MMNEVKRPKKPLIFYYVIAMVILLAINLFTVPWLAQRQVKEVDYCPLPAKIDRKKVKKTE